MRQWPFPPIAAARAAALPARAASATAMSRQLESLKARALAGRLVVDEEPTPRTTCGRKTVSLLHPPGACSAFTRSGSQYPPLGLNLLKAVVNDTARVDVIEADGYGLSVDDTLSRVRADAPLAVGMTVTCGTLELVDVWSTAVSRMGLAERPLVLVGGPAAAFETKSIFSNCPNVDVVVKGDGEVTFPAIVDLLDQKLPRQELRQRLSVIPGVAVRDMPDMSDMKIPQLPASEFGELPFPDLSSAPVSKYRAPDASRYPMVTMITQRGCIAKCTFCNTPQKDGFKIRGWSNNRIVEELKKLKRVYVLPRQPLCATILRRRWRWKGGSPPGRRQRFLPCLHARTFHPSGCG